MLSSLPVEAIETAGASLESALGEQQTVTVRQPAASAAQPSAISVLSVITDLTTESIVAAAISPMRRIKAKYRRQMPCVSHFATKRAQVIPALLHRASAFRTAQAKPTKRVTFIEGLAPDESLHPKLTSESPFEDLPCKTLSQLGAHFANLDRSLSVFLPLNATDRKHLTRTARNTKGNALSTSALRLGKRSRGAIIAEDLFRPAVKVKFAEGIDRSTVDSVKNTLLLRPAQALSLHPGDEMSIPLPGTFTSTDPGFAVKLRPVHHRVALTAPYNGEPTVRIRNLTKRAVVTLSVTEPFMILTLEPTEGHTAPREDKGCPTADTAPEAPTPLIEH